MDIDNNTRRKDISNHNSYFQWNDETNTPTDIATQNNVNNMNESSKGNVIETPDKTMKGSELIQKYINNLKRYLHGNQTFIKSEELSKIFHNLMQMQEKIPRSSIHTEPSVGNVPHSEPDTGTKQLTQNNRDSVNDRLSNLFQEKLPSSPPVVQNLSVPHRVVSEDGTLIPPPKIQGFAKFVSYAKEFSRKYGNKGTRKGTKCYSLAKYLCLSW